MFGVCDEHYVLRPVEEVSFARGAADDERLVGGRGKRAHVCVGGALNVRVFLSVLKRGVHKGAGD